MTVRTAVRTLFGLKDGPPDEARDEQGRWTTGSSIEATTSRAWSGKPIKLSLKLSKVATGHIGEAIAVAYLKQQGITDAHLINNNQPNYPIDVAGDHQLVEVKTGLASNSEGAQ